MRLTEAFDILKKEGGFMGRGKCSFYELWNDGRFRHHLKIGKEWRIYWGFNCTNIDLLSKKWQVQPALEGTKE